MEPEKKVAKPTETSMLPGRQVMTVEELIDAAINGPVYTEAEADELQDRIQSSGLGTNNP